MKLGDIYRVRRQIKKTKGFTLIELLVVISIISLLASISLSSLDSARNKAHIAALQKFEQGVYRANAHSLVGYWDLDSSTDTFIDRAHYNNGLGSGEYESVEGVIGNAINFSNGRITVPNNSSVNLGEDITISFYIKPTSISAGRQNPLHKSYRAEFSFTQEPNNNLSHYFTPTGSNYRGYQIGRNHIKENQWNHILLVRDFTNKRLKYFLNGVLMTDSSLHSSYVSAERSSDSINIGNGYAGRYRGAIDEVKIYNRAVF